MFCISVKSHISNMNMTYMEKTTIQTSEIAILCVFKDNF